MAFTCIACKREIDPSGRNCPHCGEPITDFLRTYMVELIDGKYRIIERLGRGGMGEVYKVLHTRLGAIRVIKTMRPHLMEDPSLHERFLREAKLATRIQHPNVAILHDFSQLPDNSLYMVWEFIEGTNLATMVRREGMLKPRVAIDIAIQTLAGLEAIHEAGIIHRDISPENIMVFKEPSGALRVKVIDLGIAKSEAVDGAVTRTGMFVGKWKYASPEHLGFLPEGMSIDGRADLFSFGIVLYEMLSGRAPYEATTPGQYFILHSKETPNPVTVHNLAFPEAPGLEKILARALERDRESRYPSAKEFQKALIALQSKLAEVDLEPTAVLMPGPGAGAGSGTTLAGTVAAERPSPTAHPQPTQASGLAPTIVGTPAPQAGAKAAPPEQEPLAPTIVDRSKAAQPQKAAPTPAKPAPVAPPRPAVAQPAPAVASERPKSSPALIAAAVIVVALGLGLLGAGGYSLYSKWKAGSTTETPVTETPAAGTDVAQGGTPAGATPPATQTAVPPATAAGGGAVPSGPTTAVPAGGGVSQPQYTPPAQTPPAQPQVAGTQTGQPKPAPAQTQAAPPPAAVPPPTPVQQQPPTAGATGTAKPTPPAGGAAQPPVEQLATTPIKKAAPPTATGGQAATATPPPAATPPAGTRAGTTAPPPAAAPPTGGGISPAAAAAAAGTPAATAAAPSSASAGDLIPDAGSLGWRSKALTASADWKAGFQKGIIRNYEDMYSGSPANWAAIAPGVQLSKSKVTIGKLQNLSALHRPDIDQAFPTALQTAINEEVGNPKGAAPVTAQIAVVSAVDDEAQGHVLVVEMIFRDAAGRVLAKLHHRTEGRDFEGAVEDMVTELTEFVVDHPVPSVPKKK